MLLEASKAWELVAVFDDPVSKISYHLLFRLRDLLVWLKEESNITVVDHWRVLELLGFFWR